MNIDPRLEIFNRHRTVRRYKPEPLAPGHLEQIFWAAQRAPTDATAQMYSFVRLTDPDLRTRIAAAANNPHIASASEAFLVLADVHRLRATLEHKGHTFGDWPAVGVHFAIGDAVLAGQNLLLAAELLGYAGCWIGGVLGCLPELIEWCRLPAGVLPFAGLTIGVPDEHPAQRPRVQSQLVFHENQYRAPSPEELDLALEHMAPITVRGDWAQTLSRYFAKGGAMEARENTLRLALERQGFMHVLPDLDALTERVFKLGFSGVLVRQQGQAFQAWVDKPNDARSGEGPSPTEALRAAVLEAERSHSAGG